MSDCCCFSNKGLYNNILLVSVSYQPMSDCCFSNNRLYNNSLLVSVSYQPMSDCCGFSNKRLYHFRFFGFYLY